MIEDDRNQEPRPAQSAEHEAGNRTYSPKDHFDFILDLLGIFISEICGENSETDGNERQSNKNGKNNFIWHIIEIAGF